MTHAASDSLTLVVEPLALLIQQCHFGFVWCAFQMHFNLDPSSWPSHVSTNYLSHSGSCYYRRAMSTITAICAFLSHFLTNGPRCPSAAGAAMADTRITR